MGEVRFAGIKWSWYEDHSFFCPICKRRQKHGRVWHLNTIHGWAWPGTWTSRDA